MSRSPDYPYAVEERVAQLLEGLSKTNSHHLIRWIQITGGRDKLLALLVDQARASTSWPIYIHHFNSQGELLPVITDFNGVLRRRIEEDLNDIEAYCELKNFDEKVAAAGGREALIELLFQLALERNVEGPHDIYVSTPDASATHQWGITTREEVENTPELSILTAEEIAQVRRTLPSILMADALKAPWERLAGGNYHPSVLIHNLAKEFEIPEAVVLAAIPELSRDDVTFACRAPRSAIRDSVDIEVHSGTATNTFVESVMNVSKDDKGLRVIPVARVRILFRPPPFSSQ